MEENGDPSFKRLGYNHPNGGTGEALLFAALEKLSEYQFEEHNIHLSSVSTDRGPARSNFGVCINNGLITSSPFIHVNTTQTRAFWLSSTMSLALHRMSWASRTLVTLRGTYLTQIGTCFARE